MRKSSNFTPDIHLVKPAEQSCQQCDAFLDCICADIDPVAAEQIKPLSTQAGPFLTGDYLVHRGDAFRSYYLVQCGVLRAESMNFAGRSKVKWFYFPGDLIGMEAMSEETWPADIVANSTALLCEISAADLRQAAQHYPEIQQTLFKRFGDRILHKEYALASDYSEAATVRVLEYLLKLHDRLSGTEFVADSRINLPMTKVALASYLGMTPKR